MVSQYADRFHLCRQRPEKAKGFAMPHDCPKSHDARQKPMVSQCADRFHLCRQRPERPKVSPCRKTARSLTMPDKSQWFHYALTLPPLPPTTEKAEGFTMRHDCPKSHNARKKPMVSLCADAFPLAAITRKCQRLHDDKSRFQFG